MIQLPVADNYGTFVPQRPGGRLDLRGHAARAHVALLAEGDRVVPIRVVRVQQIRVRLTWRIVVQAVDIAHYQQKVGLCKNSYPSC